MFREHEGDPDVEEFFKAFLTYLGNAAPRDKKVEIRGVVENFLSKDGNEMTKFLKEIANDFYQKGIAKGKAEVEAEVETKVKAEVKAEVSRKILDIARTMLEQGFNTETISEITKLTPGEIEKLRKQS